MNDVDFGDYFKVFWMVVVTMTTVGYGDITPKTIPGRVFTFLLTVWGVFLISILVLLFFNFTTLTESEKLALKVWDRMQMRDAIIESAAKVLGQAVKMKQTYSKGEKGKVTNIATRFKESLQEFRFLNQYPPV